MYEQALLPLIVDGKQYGVLLRLIVLSRSLRRTVVIDERGRETTDSFLAYTPTNSVILPSKFGFNDKKLEGWTAAVTKLSNCCGDYTLPVTEKELQELCGRAIRNGTFREHKGGAIEISLIPDKTQQLGLPLNQCGEEMKDAKWVVFNPSRFPSTNEQYLLRKRTGKGLFEVPRVGNED